MKTRLKELRKYFNLTQNEFGEKIGLSSSIISDIEKGRRNLTDRNITIICKEFNVDEVWLREGIGEMFCTNPSEDKITRLTNKIRNLDKDSFIRMLAEALDDLNDEDFEQLEAVGKTILNNINKKRELSD